VTSSAELDLRLTDARKVADATLYEGYVLYPYRASARKNQLRWQFGVLAPPAFAPSEACSMQTEVIVDADPDARVHVRVRALQVQARTIETPDGPVASLDTGGQVWTSFDEAVEHQLDLTDLGLDELVGAERAVELSWPGGAVSEPIYDAGGGVLGRAVRRRWPVEGTVRVRAAWCDGLHTLARVTVIVENTGSPPDGDVGGRDAVVRGALVAVHTLAAVDGGRFLSAVDPPDYAHAEAAGCSNAGTFPVLIDDDVILSSPIILYDRPAVAPESAGDMFDATEIDEILALRVLTLTDDEKREARGTDPRAAAVVDRCDGMTPDHFAALHGTFRSIRFDADGEADEQWVDPSAIEPPGQPWWEPAVDAAFDPWSDTVWIGSVEVGQGTRVRLCPSRRADAQDLFVDGRLATVTGVFHDVDGAVHLAVVVDDELAAEEHAWHGRYLYFGPEEVEVLTP
jgi:hypothetical protein